MTTDGDLIVLSDDEEVLMFKGTVEMGQSKEAIRPPKEKDKFAELRKCAECSAFLGSGKSHLLECLHVLCQNCLDAKFSDSNFESSPPACPVCKQKILADRVRDYLLPDVIGQLVTAQNSEKLCQCPDAFPATSVCLMCKDFICDVCVAAHLRVRSARDHIVKKIGEEGTDCVPLVSMRCLTHPSEELLYLCETCKQLTCKDCQLSSVHKNHQTAEVQAVASKDKLRNLRAKNEKTIQTINSSSMVFKAKIQALTNLKQKLQQQLIQEMSAVRKALREREAEIRGLIETVCDSQQNGIQMRHDMCNNIASSSQQALSLASAALESGTDTAIVYTTLIMGIQESLVERVMTTCIDAPYAQMPVELVSPTKEQLLDEIHRFLTLTVSGRSLEITSEKKTPTEITQTVAQLQQVAQSKEIIAEPNQPLEIPHNPGTVTKYSPRETLISALGAMVPNTNAILNAYNDAIQSDSIGKTPESVVQSTIKQKMTDHPISNSQNNNFNPSFSEPNILKHVATSGKKSNSQSRTHPFPTDLRSVPPTLGGQFGQNLDRLSLAPPPQKRRRSTINQIASVTQQQQQKMLKGMQKMKEQHVEPICQQPAQQYQMPQQKSMCHMYPGGTVNPYDQTLQVSSQLNYQHIDDSFNAEYQQRFQQHQNQMYYQHSTASQYYPEQPQQFYHNPAYQMQQQQQHGYSLPQQMLSQMQQPQQQPISYLRPQSVAPTTSSAKSNAGSANPYLSTILSVRQTYQQQPPQQFVSIPQTTTIAGSHVRPNILGRRPVVTPQQTNSLAVMPPPPCSPTVTSSVESPSSSDTNKNEKGSQPNQSNLSLGQSESNIKSVGNDQQNENGIYSEIYCQRGNNPSTTTLSSKTPSAPQKQHEGDRSIFQCHCALCAESNPDQLVKCSNCGRTYHYFCHLPNIGAQEVILSTEKLWTCTLCAKVEMDCLDQIYENEIAPCNICSAWEIMVCRKIYMEIFCSPILKVPEFSSLKSTGISAALKKLKRGLADEAGCFSYGNIVEFLVDLNALFTAWFNESQKSPVCLENLHRLQSVYKKAVEAYARPQYVAIVNELPIEI